MVPIFNGRPKYDAYLYDSETGFKSLIHPTGDTFSFSLNLAPLAYTDRFKIVFDKTQQIRRGYSTIVMSPDSVSMAPRNIAFMDNDTLKIAPAFTKTTADGLYEPKFSKGTAFNKNFGRSTGTVVDGSCIDCELEPVIVELPLKFVVNFCDLLLPNIIMMIAKTNTIPRNATHPDLPL
jgi:hypothetical protein